jgi:hypothetical protein
MKEKMLSRLERDKMAAKVSRDLHCSSMIAMSG